MNNAILLHIVLPDGQQYLPIWVQPEWPIYALTQYIDQLGYLPNAESGYGLIVRGQWLTANYTIADLGLEQEETIHIAPLPAQPKYNTAVRPLFGGGKYTKLMNAIKAAQNTAAPAYATAPTTASKDSLFTWLKKLLS